MPASPRLAASLLALLAALGLAACGAKKEDPSAPVVRASPHVLAPEGLYYEIGGLKYQIQISRQLNPSDSEDRGYLRGIPAGQSRLKSGETWFGIFLRVQNESSRPIDPARELAIRDTQGNVFRPIGLNATNVFAYNPTAPIGPREVLPQPDTPAAETTIQGSVVLFKMTNLALDNRPLELEIKTPDVPQQTAIIDLDV